MSTNLEPLAHRRLNSPATNSQASKSMKMVKHPYQHASTLPPRTPSSATSSHFAMIELKQQILVSLSKLGDRDTYQIAVDDLENIIASLSRDEVPMVVNSLCDASSDPKSAVKKESIRLISVLCRHHGDTVLSQLSKIIAHIVKRLKDSDSAVRDSCSDAIGVLSSQYLKGDGENGGNSSLVPLFVKPLLDSMNEQNKVVQAGSAQCLAKLIDCAAEAPIVSFQKLCPKICKLLSSPNFLAKGALLPVVASLSQVGAVASQGLEMLMKSIHSCLGSPDWATRKAAADALSALATHSSKLVVYSATSTLEVLEGCRFDKVRPVRDSVMEALQALKKMSEIQLGHPDDLKAIITDGGTSEAAEVWRKEQNILNPGEVVGGPSGKESCISLSPTSDCAANIKGSGILEKAVGILKKKAPGLTDKELNPEFFQKLEIRDSDDLPVEVVVPRKCPESSSETNEKDPKVDLAGMSNRGENGRHDKGRGCAVSKYHDIKKLDLGSSKCESLVRFGPEECIKGRVVAKGLNARENVDDGIDIDIQEPSDGTAAHSKKSSQFNDSVVDSKGNWMGIQKQLLLLERQQAHLLNLLRDFMSGSHESMVTLENRVRGLERVVDVMAKDLSSNSGRRASGFVGSKNLPKYNGFHNYGANSRTEDDDLLPFANTNWRNHPEFLSTMSAREEAVHGHRRGWSRSVGHARSEEVTSARSVWQASKDDAMLETIRAMRADSLAVQTEQPAVPESDTETLGDEESVQEQNPLCGSWTGAVDALQIGEIDSAYAEVLSTGSGHLLVKLMGISGPVMDQLWNETRSEVLQALGHFMQDQNLFKICLPWIQQLVDMVMEDGPDIMYIPMEVKREILVSLSEAEVDDSDEDLPHQLLCQLASAWGVDIQQLQNY